MAMLKIFTVLWLVISSVWAKDIDIRIRPERPTLNETFEMDVTVTLEGSEEPYISFDPGELVVEGRRQGGVSFSTQLINGQFTSKKTMTFVYQLRANRSGTFYLRNFKVQLGDRELTENNVRITVLQEAERPKDYFIEAIPSKDKVYKGEGFFVDYYLYTRVPIYNQELKEYPKLNGFLKRFKNVDETPSRVERGGVIYQRSKKYSAKLFAEKTGNLTIDALKLQVSVGFGNPGFGGFGLRDMRNVVLSSSPVNIMVSEPPIEGMDESFTGLIGEHKFSFTMAKNKYLANEPIELKLEITGPGLLEKMEDPIFYSHPDLESFDTRSEIQEISDGGSRKVIEYTYLPRGAMKIAQRQLSLSVFLPSENRYETVTLEIPALEVIGGANANPPTHRSGNDNVSSTVVQVPTVEKVTLSPVGPFGEFSRFDRYLSARVLLGLAAAFLLVALATNLKFQSSDKKSQLWHVYKKNLARGIDYQGLHNFLSVALPESTQNLERAIITQNIPNDVKSYFVDLVKELRMTTFTAGSNPRKIQPKARMFKKFVKSVT